MGEACWENIWAMKSIMRCFELIFGLKVNFQKSNLVGVNVDEGLLALAATFLNCKRSGLSFKFLGLPVRANPRSLSTWEPVINTMQSRSASWKGRHLSLRGRITLINSVLNSLPIYYMSFPRIPGKVLKRLTKNRRDFLWGATEDKRKISG